MAPSGDPVVETKDGSHIILSLCEALLHQRLRLGWVPLRNVVLTDDFDRSVVDKWLQDFVLTAEHLLVVVVAGVAVEACQLHGGLKRPSSICEAKNSACCFPAEYGLNTTKKSRGPLRASCS